MSREFTRSPSISVEAGPDGEVLMTIWPDPLKREEEPLRFTLDPETASNLTRELTSQTLYSLRHVVKSLQFGDCPTCQNLRLVEVPAPGGRTQRVHCPECVPARLGDNDYARPRLGGGVR